LIRPSLCVQAREGRLHVFLPYASRLSDYLDLVAAIEDTCQYLQTPVWLEGYTPPSDPRLRSFSVTPDPGVLEVNLPPASNWDELEQINTLLFEEARRNRLTAEKFTYEGGHVATGGGSHIVVGGAAILDSPFCAVQICCRAWWLSGRTIQYPRVDEARTDALYELEVAFRNLPASDCPPFIVDGLFRNLLVDVTGNYFSYIGSIRVREDFSDPGSSATYPNPEEDRYFHDTYAAQRGGGRHRLSLCIGRSLPRVRALRVLH